MHSATYHARMFIAAGLAVALFLVSGAPSRAASVAVVQTDRSSGRLGRSAVKRLARSLRARGIKAVACPRRRFVSRRAAVRRSAARHGADAVVTATARRRGKRWLLTVRVFGSDGRPWLARRLRLRRQRLPWRTARRLAARIERKLGRGIASSGASGSRTRTKSTTSAVAQRTPATAEYRTKSTSYASAPEAGEGVVHNSSAHKAEASVSDRAPGGGAGMERSGHWLTVGASLDTATSTNLFLDGSGAWDLLLQPRLTLAADVSRVMSVGYQGEVNSYLEHENLLSHWHQLRLVANPAWGTPGQPGSSELLVRVTAETLRNQPAYEVINHVRTSADAHVHVAFTRWLRWTAAAGVGYRFFYQDRPSDTLDAWVSTRFAFVLPTRTTLMPRVRYGLRAYPNPVSARTRDFHDHQIEVGMHISQALWRRAGLQLDYAYVMTPGSSSLIERNLTRQQFNYLGLDFCCGGHQAGATLKQLLGGGISMGLSAVYQERRYNGWPAVDDNLQPTGADRHDHRLVPGAFVAFAWRARNATSGLGLRAGYQFVRQWSNSSWYDAMAHVGSLSVWGTW